MDHNPNHLPNPHIPNHGGEIEIQIKDENADKGYTSVSH